MAIINNPFDLVEEAFKNLWPDKGYYAEFVVDLKDDDGNPVFGQTFFPDDDTTPLVSVMGDMKIADACEIFAHELAHVAAGKEHSHDTDWNLAYESLHYEYNRLGEKYFGSLEGDNNG